MVYSIAIWIKKKRKEKISPTNTVLEIVIGRVSKDRAEANGKGEEALGDGGVPNIRLPQFVPIGRNEKKDSVHCPFEGHRSDQ